MVLKLALLGGLIGLTLVLCGPVRFPGVKMLFSMAIATGLVLLAYYDIVFIILICVIVPVAVTQIAQIGWILGKNGDEEE